MLMYSTHNEGKSVIAEKFIKILGVKIYKKMKANGCKSNLSFLNKLVDQYNNTFIILLIKNLWMLVILLWLKKLRPILKFKANDRFRITKHKNIFSKGYTKNWLRETFIVDSVLKTNPLIYKIKDSNGEKVIGSFYEK